MDTNTSSVWFAVSMGLLGVIVGYALATGMGSTTGGMVAVNNPPAQPQGDTNVPVPPPTNEEPADADDDPVLGSEDATVTVIEFTDYQCPFCSRHFTQTLGQIKSNYVDTGKVKYVVRDYPLSFHPNAQKASEATECADDQDKFWEMHDKLFTAQQEWSSLSGPDAIAKFKEYAGAMGVDAGEFADCLDGGTYAEEVKQDMADGSAAGISGTPGFWILGPDNQSKLISGAYPYETFQATIDEYLN